MTESKQAPTPGPWTIEEYGDDDSPALVIHKDTETRICFMATPGSHGDPEIISANARLIAAAPDLLAALELGIGAVGLLARKEDLEKYPQILAWIEQATIALSKSRGEG